MKNIRMCFTMLAVVLWLHNDNHSFSAVWPISNSDEPMADVITSPFGIRYGSSSDPYTYHGGVDIAAVYQAVHCVDSGRLAEFGETDAEGRFVYIQHKSDPKASFYCHMDYFPYVYAIGAMFEEGQYLGLSGNTGISSGPHLIRVFSYKYSLREGRKKTISMGVFNALTLVCKLTSLRT